MISVLVLISLLALAKCAPEDGACAQPEAIESVFPLTTTIQGNSICFGFNVQGNAADVDKVLNKANVSSRAALLGGASVTRSDCEAIFAAEISEIAVPCAERLVDNFDALADDVQSALLLVIRQAGCDDVETLTRFISALEDDNAVLAAEELASVNLCDNLACACNLARSCLDPCGADFGRCSVPDVVAECDAEAAAAAVDCKWGQWSSWTKCDAACADGWNSGSGSSQRARKHLTKASNGGKACTGDAEESKSCSISCSNNRVLPGDAKSGYKKPAAKNNNNDSEDDADVEDDENAAVAGGALGAGELAGIAVGSVVALALILFLVVWAAKRNGNATTQPTEFGEHQNVGAVGNPLFETKASYHNALYDPESAPPVSDFPPLPVGVAPVGGQDEFRCDECGSCYGSQSKLESHQKKRHA